MSTVVCAILSLTAYAQDYYWVGPLDGNWNQANNWSATSGGTGGLGVPNSTSHNAIFNSNARLVFDIPTTVDLNSLTVTGNSTVKITADATGGLGTKRLEVNSTNSGSPALKIDAGSRLEDSAVAGVLFEVKFAANSKGSVSGQWYFTSATVDDGAYFSLPGAGASSTNLTVNSGGSIIISPTGFTSDIPAASENYLVFAAGSTLHLMDDGPLVPKANYNSESTILITGIINAGIFFDELNSVGNITYNCPGQNNSPLAPPLGLKSSLIVTGNVTIQNTNGQELMLLQNTGTSTISGTINGNLSISGDSRVAVSEVNNMNTTSILNLNGNLVADGLSFSLQNSSLPHVLTTTLFVKGNIQHTSGTFEPLATATNESTSLYVIELNGESAQVISSHNGSFDNATHQVTLRINNADGVTLNSPLEVGRLSFNSTNLGNINTTSTNILTINNTSGDPIVLNRPANSGFVNGPLRRRTASTDECVFPTGDGSTFRQVSIVPATSVESVYEATYFNTPHSSSSVLNPISGLAPYYWDVNKISGANAKVKMTIAGAISGADAEDALVVVHYNGSNWESVKGTAGTILTPGNSSSGTILSDELSSFSPFTIAFALQSALPIHLVSFNAKKDADGKAQLTWNITDNSTPANFEILESSDGVDFNKAGSVVGVEGKLNYQFSDNTLTAGNNYFRLRMIDKDGSVSFSNIVVVMNGTRGVIISSMIPTMVRDRARLNISSSIKGSIQLVVTDINGRIVMNQKSAIDAGNQELWIDASRLSTGMFQITGYINGEKTATIRFIKR